MRRALRVLVVAGIANAAVAVATVVRSGRLDHTRVVRNTPDDCVC